MEAARETFGTEKLRKEILAIVRADIEKVAVAEKKLEVRGKRRHTCPDWPAPRPLEPLQCGDDRKDAPVRLALRAGCRRRGRKGPSNRAPTRREH